MVNEEKMNEKIANITMHNIIQKQKDFGVVNLATEIKSLLLFEELPSHSILSARAIAIADIVEKEGFKTAMIGGAPFFMPSLSKELETRGIKVLFSFSKRVSVEEEGEGGEVIKRSSFVFEGFVENPS